MNVREEMFKQGLRIMRAAVDAQLVLSRIALDDCNKFCKLDTGELIKSSERASSMLRGRLVWDTSYARRAYYTGEANKTKNPVASRMWAHKAASLYSDKWKRTVENVLFGRGM
jgi:hypothetical protein